MPKEEPATVLPTVFTIGCVAVAPLLISSKLMQLIFFNLTRVYASATQIMTWGDKEISSPL